MEWPEFRWKFISVKIGRTERGVTEWSYWRWQRGRVWSWTWCSNGAYETGTCTGRTNRGKRELELLAGFQNQPALYAVVSVIHVSGKRGRFGRGSGVGWGWAPEYHLCRSPLRGLWDVQVKTGKEGQDAQTSGTEEKLSTDLVVSTGT